MAQPNYVNLRSRTMCTQSSFLPSHLARAHQIYVLSVQRSLLNGKVIHIKCLLPHYQSSMRYTHTLSTGIHQVLSRPTILSLATWDGICRAFLWACAHDTAKIFLPGASEDGPTYHGAPVNSTLGRLQSKVRKGVRGWIYP